MAAAGRAPGTWSTGGRGCPVVGARPVLEVTATPLVEVGSEFGVDDVVDEAEASEEVVVVEPPGEVVVVTDVVVVTVGFSGGRGGSGGWVGPTPGS